MSPEQGTADLQADTRSDSYSFGGLVYEAVTLLELLPRDDAWPVLDDPVFMPLRNDARFQVLLDSAHLLLAQQ